MKFLFAVCLLSLFSLALSGCSIPPKHWCDSQQIAEECGVEKACSNYMWQAKSAKPVQISLFYESLCPGCREFITTMLYPTYKTFHGSGIMELDMTPYGNAKEVEASSGMWNYTCQHGPEECTGNFIENCLMKYTGKKVDTYFPVVYCMEVASDPIAAAEKCIKDAQQDWKSIDMCSGNHEGNSLMHEAALKTGALDPKHTYVPWILVNGKHTEDLQNKAMSDLPKLLCEMYTGVKPKECDKYLDSVGNFPLCQRK